MITLAQDRNIFILQFFLLFLTGDCYELKCSVASQRRHRSNNFCSIAGEEYMCLLDVIKGHNIELCTKKRDFQRPGYKIVWSGNFDGQTCDIERYQPISHFNLDGSNCIFKKSSCNEEGQITVEDGSQRDDKRCRCDYRRGYAFVTEPFNKCNCIPSKEDCSCYMKNCPFLKKLSPDYKCIWQDDLHRSFNCTTMLERGVDEEKSGIKEYKKCNTDNRADSKKFGYSYFHADPYCTLHIVYTTMFLIMFIGITSIAYFSVGRRRPIRIYKRKYSDKTVHNNGLAGQHMGEPAYMKTLVSICCNGEGTVISPKQSQKTISKKGENMNHVSMNAEIESFFGKEEVQTFRKLFLSIVKLSKNIGNTTSEDEIDKQFYHFLSEIYFILPKKYPDDKQ